MTPESILIKAISQELDINESQVIEIVSDNDDTDYWSTIIRKLIAASLKAMKQYAESEVKLNLEPEYPDDEEPDYDHKEEYRLDNWRESKE